MAYHSWLIAVALYTCSEVARVRTGSDVCEYIRSGATLPLISNTSCKPWWYEGSTRGRLGAPLAWHITADSSLLPCACSEAGVGHLCVVGRR